LPQVALLILAIAAATTASEADRKTATIKTRPYADGPLAPDDFAGKPPATSPVNFGIEMVANTECQVRYEYRTAIEHQRDGRWTARIKSFTCTAMVDREKCWNTLRESRRVLDHEQGHFDLAEIAARRAQQHFAGLMREGNVLATARDRRTVERQVEALIKKEMESLYQSLNQAQKTYDEETRHGTAFLAQRRHRAYQRAELEKLTPAK
jgi:hypothetical protein